MGNCLISRNNKISAQEFEASGEVDKVMHAEAGTVNSAATTSEPERKKKKRVSFESEEGQGSNCGSEGVRIRVVVTKEELRRILEYENDAESNSASLQQLLSDIKLRGTRISHYDDDSMSVKLNDPVWRPSLESIPEENLVK